MYNPDMKEYAFTKTDSISTFDFDALVKTVAEIKAKMPKYTSFLLAFKNQMLVATLNISKQSEETILKWLDKNREHTIMEYRDYFNSGDYHAVHPNIVRSVGIVPYQPNGGLRDEDADPCVMVQGGVSSNGDDRDVSSP